MGMVEQGCGIRRGDRVVIEGSAEERKHVGKVWEVVIFDPWPTGDGTMLAKIALVGVPESEWVESETYYGGYACHFLRVIRAPDGC